MSARAEQQLERRLSDHRAALQEYMEKAGTIDPAQWLLPRGVGKWTPAQETRHLLLAYQAFIRDLEGGTPMRLRGTPLKRRLWRLIGLNSILWRKRIPVAVNAPGETRPEWEPSTAADLLPQLQRLADDFHSRFSHVWRSEPKRRVTHPMFGALTLDQAIQLLSVHTRHHAALLPARAHSHADPQMEKT